MRKYLIMFFLIIMIICLPIISKAEDIWCKDLPGNITNGEIGDKQFNSSLVSSNVLANGGKTNDMYDFLTRQINVNQLTPEQKPIYAQLLIDIVDVLGKEEASFVQNGNSGEGPLAKLLHNYGTAEDEKKKLEGLMKDAGGTEYQTKIVGRYFNSTQTLEDLPDNASEEEIEEALTNYVDKVRREPKKVYILTNSGTNKERKERTSIANKDLGTIMGEANAFVNSGSSADINAIEKDDIKLISDFLYNILFGVGIVIAVVIGILVGIKLMTGSVEQKAEAKQYLIPYIAGCVVVFGGFGIWKLVVEILNGFAN